MTVSSTQPVRILIVRPSALGDVSRTVPCLASLCAAYPQAQIDWLVQDTYADVVAHHPALTRVVPFPRRKFAAWWWNPRVAEELLDWRRELRRARYDLVFDFQGLARSGLFTWLTGAPVRVGFANARELGWLGYNRRYAIDRGLHTVDRMLGLLQAHGLNPVPDMRLYLGPREQQWLAQFLRENALTDQPYAVLAPTAQWLCKCWPIERFVALTKKLLGANFGIQKIIVLAAPHERAYIQPLRDAFPSAPSIPSTANLLFPVTTIGQMMALLSRARVLVCNDSAPLHIAVGFGRPVVAVFGPTDPALVGPYGRTDMVVRPDHSAAENLTHYRRHRNDQSLIGRVTLNLVWASLAAQLAPQRGNL